MSAHCGMWCIACFQTHLFFCLQLIFLLFERWYLRVFIVDRKWRNRPHTVSEFLSSFWMRRREVETQTCVWIECNVFGSFQTKNRLNQSNISCWDWRETSQNRKSCLNSYLKGKCTQFLKFLRHITPSRRHPLISIFQFYLNFCFLRFWFVKLTSLATW